MRTVRVHALLAAGAVAAILLSGCGKSSPTAPEGTAAAPAEPGRQRVTLYWAFVEVINDGDLIGAGDFEFRRGLNGSRTFTSKTLGTGDEWEIDKTEYFTAEVGTRFSVYFEATEWDADILGNEFPDPDMDGRSKTSSFTIGSERDGTRSITLGNDDCKVRVYFHLSFAAVSQAQAARGGAGMASPMRTQTSNDPARLNHRAEGD